MILTASDMKGVAKFGSENELQYTVGIAIKSSSNKIEWSWLIKICASIHTASKFYIEMDFLLIFMISYAITLMRFKEPNFFILEFNSIPDQLFVVTNQ